MTEHEQSVMEELAEQLYAELLRRGTPEPEARSQVAAELEMWGRVFGMRALTGARRHTAPAK